MKSGPALFMVESFGQLAYDSNHFQRSSSRVEYVPRNAESTVLHRVTREYLETFLVEANLRSGDSGGVPDFIEDEFRKFLECGILAKGFARLKCDTCDFERLVPFSCKCRGVCPSCAGRRMAERAAHLVDEVFPEVPVRQFVLSLPFALRYKLAWDHNLTRAVLGVFSRVLLRFYSKKARTKGIKNGRGGAVTVIQRAGGALNLNVHFHTAALDGVFTFSNDKGLKFHRVAAPTKDDMVSLVKTIRKRVLKLLERRGIVLKGEDASFDSLAEEYPALAGTYAASIQHLVALGPRSGRRVMRFGADPEDQPVRIKAKRHARLNGFDLHASKAVRAGDKERLERLLRYLLRPPVAKNRLKLLDDGKVLLELKTKWNDGTTHMLFEPVEFLEKLAAVIPRPQINLVIYHGVLAPNSKMRKLVVSYTKNGGAHGMRPNEEKDEREGKEEGKPRYYNWAELMRRTFDIDVMRCPKCGGRMKLISVIEDQKVIRKILEHLNLPTDLPTTVPARASPQQEELDFYPDE